MMCIQCEYMCMALSHYYFLYVIFILYSFVHLWSGNPCRRSVLLLKWHYLACLEQHTNWWCQVNTYLVNNRRHHHHRQFTFSSNKQKERCKKVVAEKQPFHSFISPRLFTGIEKKDSSNQCNSTTAASSSDQKLPEVNPNFHLKRRWTKNGENDDDDNIKVNLLVTVEWVGEMLIKQHHSIESTHSFHCIPFLFEFYIYLLLLILHCWPGLT